MPQPLTAQETQSVLRLLNRIGAAHQLMVAGLENWHTSVPLNPNPVSEDQETSKNLVWDLIHAGAHHLVFAHYPTTLMQYSDPSLALQVSISALLWDEHKVADAWAMLALQSIKSGLPDEDYKQPWGGAEVTLLKLAKVFRALRKSPEEQWLRDFLNGQMNTLQTGRDPGLESVRLAVELGYIPEAHALASKLPPLLVGHSRVYLTGRLFRTLLRHGQEVLGWALIAMTSEEHDEVSLRDAAIGAACELQDFTLAMKFATNDGFKEVMEESHLDSIAQWLVAAKSTHHWRTFWNLITTNEHRFCYRFSRDHYLAFLASLVEHVPQKDRAVMFKIANEMRLAMADIPNQEYARKVFNMSFSIAVWGAPKATVRKLVKQAQVSGRWLSSAMRAAVQRNMPFLLEEVPDLHAQMVSAKSYRAMEVELERMKHHQPHQLEALFEARPQKAIAANEDFEIFQLISFLGRNWKDIDRYRELLARHPKAVRSILSFRPLTKPHVKAGNLIGLESEISQIHSASIVYEALGELSECLRNRFGLQDLLRDF